MSNTKLQKSKAVDSNGNVLGENYPETNGVQTAVLLEDFLITAAAVGGPFCRCSFPDLGMIDSGSTPSPIPLVYVPFLALGYSLQKGDTILVKFDFDDPRFPYFWYQDPNAAGAVLFPVPTTDAPQPASGGSNPSLTFPSQSTDDYTFNILGNGLIVASNAAYTCIVFTDSGSGNQQAYYFSKTGMILFSPQGSVGIQAATEFDIVVGPNKYVFKSDGTFTVTSQAGTLLKLDASGNLVIMGKVTAGLEVTANSSGVSTTLSAHMHPTAGVGPPSKPIPGT